MPNALTCLALVCGVTAIRFGIDGDFQAAVAAIILAMGLDALDGRVARALNGTSRFGAELDSLADLINFGVAPGVLLWLWSLHALGHAGWLAVIVLALACCLRLARFNVAATEADRPAWTAKYFTGVAAPAGAALAMAPLYMDFAGLIAAPDKTAPYVAVYTATVAALMVSRVPTFSCKTWRLTSAGRWMACAAGAACVAAVILHTWTMLLVAAVVYIALIPVSAWCYWCDTGRVEHEGPASQTPAPRPRPGVTRPS